eukprot:16387433-Heterocapsa_arctica.AAC.1
MMREQTVGHVGKHSQQIGKDQYGYWDENMNKLTESLEDSRSKSQEKNTGCIYCASTGQRRNGTT